jgi:GTP cyclohydrolase IA
MNNANIKIENATFDLLEAIGENPDRQGLVETPNRVAKAWLEMTSGYSKSAEEILKVFEDGAENYDQMVTVKNIPFYSHCEHHLVPFFGTVAISYIPDGKIVGLSKLSRLVQAFAKRLQVQERMTAQIADALNEHLSPKGVGVYVKARHLCMESRGICQQGSETITTALRGIILDDASAKAEFLRSL